MDETRSDRNPAAEPPDLSYQWMIFGILTFSHFLMAMLFFGWGPLAPMLKGELGIDNSQLGFIVSAMYFAMTLVSVPSGFLVDKYAARVMLMLSVSLVGTATFVLSLSSTYTILFLVAALGGAGYGMINQITTKGLMYWFEPSKRATIMGIKQTGVTLGGSQSPHRCRVGGRRVGCGLSRRDRRAEQSEDVWLTPVFPCEDWTLETRDAATDAIVRKTLDLAPRHAAVLGGAGLNTAIRTPIAVARAGRGRELPKVLERYYAAFAPLPNGMSLFEGPTAASVEHLGLLATTLQEALVQSVSPHSGESEITGVFPAWPSEWDASFRLLVRGGFLVSSEMKEGKVTFVEIESRLGEECLLRNPWAGTCVVSEINGGGRVLAGELLRSRRQRASPLPVYSQGVTASEPRHQTRHAPIPISGFLKYTQGSQVQGHACEIRRFVGVGFLGSNPPTITLKLAFVSAFLRLEPDDP